MYAPTKYNKTISPKLMPKVSQINPSFRMPNPMEVVQHQLFKIYNATARKSSSDGVVNGCMFMEPETELKKNNLTTTKPIYLDSKRSNYYLVWKIYSRRPKNAVKLSKTLSIQSLRYNFSK